MQSLIFVGAITSVAFPTLTALLNKKPDAWRPYFKKWLIIVATLMFFISATLAVFLPLILSLWVGENLNPISVTIGQILCVGVFANSIGTMFYALLHAQGRADLTAKLHMLELPFFLFGLFISVKAFGVTGVAFAWVGRMVFDTIMLAWLVKLQNA